MADKRVWTPINVLKVRLPHVERVAATTPTDRAGKRRRDTAAHYAARISATLKAAGVEVEQ